MSCTYLDERPDITNPEQILCPCAASQHTMMYTTGLKKDFGNHSKTAITLHYRKENGRYLASISLDEKKKLYLVIVAAP